MLDSKEITQEIRETLVKAIQRSTAQKILIVHGTDTMVETLEYLENKITNKTLILTGSMIPLKQFILSDGGFNLGYALAQLQTLENGSYLCMNAQTFKAGEVQKDFKNARFEKTRH